MKIKLYILSILSLVAGIALGQGIHLRTAVTQSVFTDEQWPGANPTRQGYNAGFDVVIEDGATLIMPGLHFQKMSLLPVKQDWTNPYAEYTDIKIIKLPLQIGFCPFETKLSDLKIHGGLVANFLAGIDTNDKFVEEDFNDVRGAFIVGATFRVFFMTIHASYEYGFSKIYVDNPPSGITSTSKERMLAFGLGIYF